MSPGKRHDSENNHTQHQDECARKTASTIVEEVAVR